MGLFSTDKYTDYFLTQGYKYIAAVRMGNTVQHYNMPLEAFTNNDYSPSASGISQWLQDWGGEGSAPQNYSEYRGDLKSWNKELEKRAERVARRRRDIEENNKDVRNPYVDPNSASEDIYAPSKSRVYDERTNRLGTPQDLNEQDQQETYGQRKIIDDGAFDDIKNFLTDIPNGKEYLWLQNYMPDGAILKFISKFPGIRNDANGREITQAFVDAVNARTGRENVSASKAVDLSIKEFNTEQDIFDALARDEEFLEEKAKSDYEADVSFLKAKKNLGKKTEETQELTEEIADEQRDRSEDDFRRSERERQRARELQDRALSDLDEQTALLREERRRAISNYAGARQDYQDDRQAQKGLISELRNAPSTYEEAARQGHEQSLKNQSALASLLPTRAGGSAARDILNQQKELDLNIAQSSAVGRLEEINQRRSQIANILAAQQGSAQNQQQLDLAQSDASRLGISTEVGLAGVPLGIADSARQDSYADRGLSDTNLQTSLQNYGASLGLEVDNLKLQQAIDSYNKSGDQQAFQNSLATLGLGLNALSKIGIPVASSIAGGLYGLFGSAAKSTAGGGSGSSDSSKGTERAVSGINNWFNQQNT